MSGKQGRTTKFLQGRVVSSAGDADALIQSIKGSPVDAQIKLLAEEVANCSAQITQLAGLVNTLIHGADVPEQPTAWTWMIMRMVESMGATKAAELIRTKPGVLRKYLRTEGWVPHPNLLRRIEAGFIAMCVELGDRVHSRSSLEDDDDDDGSA
jgi:hypothetical protein